MIKANSAKGRGAQGGSTTYRGSNELRSDSVLSEDINGLTERVKRYGDRNAEESGEI